MKASTRPRRTACRVARPGRPPRPMSAGSSPPNAPSPGAARTGGGQRRVPPLVGARRARLPAGAEARQAALQARPLPAVPLDWWPAYAEIAVSGDLGFTTGPYIVGTDGRRGHGWYFTIWRRQPRRKLALGPRPRPAAPARPRRKGPRARVDALPGGRPSPSAKAFGNVRSAEAQLAAALATDARSALPRFLAADGRLMRVGPQPAVGAAAWGALLAAGPERIDTAPLGGAASAGGDLAFTYGTARWRNGEVGGRGPLCPHLAAPPRRLEADRRQSDRVPPPPPARPSRPVSSAKPVRSCDEKGGLSLPLPR